MLRRPLVAVAVAGCLGAASFATLSQAATRETPASALAKKAAATPQAQLPSPRGPSTADRYAPASGCFTIRSVSGAVVPGGPFRFHAFDLGKYLLVGPRGTFLSTAADPLPTREAVLFARGYVDGTGDERIQPVHAIGDSGLDTAATVAETATAPLKAQLRGDGIELAAAASASSEWVLKQVGSAFVLQQGFDDGSPETPGPVDPPIAATLVSSGGWKATSGAVTGKAAQLRLAPAKGCAGWTESATGVSGPHATGATPYGVTQGYLDAHMHLMSQEFLGGRMICGRVTHPYGITKALVDCPDHALAGGRGAVAEDFLSGHNPGTGHDTVGWPTFGYWPNPHSLTHQGVYYKWLERSWLAGQRMLTVLLVENGQLCEIYPLKKYSCDEMTSVRREALRTFELQRYVDAQAGGPGRGWFRIVKDPFQARRVVNQGRLAVVLGMEVSRPLGCREYLGTSSCTDAQVDQRLQELYDLGVRQMEATNKFDNAFTGVKGDNATLGLLVNSANEKETGHFWKFGACKAPFGKVQSDNRQYNVADDGDPHLGRDSLFGAVLATVGATGVAPLYPQGPQCNEIGLTAQGRVLLSGMVKRGMVFDPDHMSAYARQASLDALAKIGYSGVVSSHSWADDANYFKILKMGGVVTPYAGDSSGFLGKWELLRSKADPRFQYGVGWGSDINGFGSQGSARNPAPGKGVSYPFRTLGGATVKKLTTGKRTWDVNKDGVSGYGLYPDWVQDVTVQAGRDGAAFRRDLANGVEAYLQMWERAQGITGDSCRPDVADVTAGDRAHVKRGMTPEQVVTVLGQPHTRIGRAFTYCGRSGTVTIRFTAAGRTT
ncbi:MAG TPA: hypothetical protein VMZ11_07920 [Mycobacteriales bacterium]|nr:hypothetical protein [Mycobacteriales bacterium]